MLRVIAKITVTQIPTTAFPKRNGTLIFDFYQEFEANSTWRDLTDKGTITLPKDVYVRNQVTGALTQLAGTNINLGGFAVNSPQFLRGDQITIEAGYKYQDSRGVERLMMMGIKDVAPYLFSGFISRVTSKKPFTLELEDNMWILKQISCPSKIFSFKTYTLETMLKEMLKGTGFTVNVLSSTTMGNGMNLGDFRSTSAESISQMLARIRKDYGFESYFRGNELRCGLLVYIESEARTQTFRFQENIITDDLEYQRKDDITLSAKAYSFNKIKQTSTTKDGHVKTRTEHIEALVSFKNGKFVSEVKRSGQKADFAPNIEGERYTYHFWNVTDANELIALAKAKLQQYYYTGFRGKFTTFGLPFVRHGDNAQILDAILPERNGLYKIRSVKYTGRNGLRQEIELDYKIGLQDRELL